MIGRIAMIEELGTVVCRWKLHSRSLSMPSGIVPSAFADHRFGHATAYRSRRRTQPHTIDDRTYDRRVSDRFLPSV